MPGRMATAWGQGADGPAVKDADGGWDERRRALGTLLGGLAVSERVVHRLRRSA